MNASLACADCAAWQPRPCTRTARGRGRRQLRGRPATQRESQQGATSRRCSRWASDRSSASRAFNAKRSPSVRAVPWRKSSGSTTRRRAQLASPLCMACGRSRQQTCQSLPRSLESFVECTAACCWSSETSTPYRSNSLWSSERSSGGRGPCGGRAVYTKERAKCHQSLLWGNGAARGRS